MAAARKWFSPVSRNVDTSEGLTRMSLEERKHEREPKRDITTMEHVTNLSCGERKVTSLFGVGDVDKVDWPWVG